MLKLMRARHVALFFIIIALAWGVPAHEARAMMMLDSQTGGDCSSFGTWDQATLTCRITADLAETVVIDGDGITLDGAEHTLGGLYIDSRSNITIKNLVFTGASAGITAFYAPSLMIASSTFQDGGQGLLLFNSDHAVVRDNVAHGLFRFAAMFDSNNLLIEGNTLTAESSENQGILLFTCRDGTIAQNSFSAINQALFLFDSSDDNDIHDNTLSGSSEALFVFDSNKNKIYNNTLSKNDQSLVLYGASIGNKIYHNNFINNGENAIDFSDTMNNSFNLSKIGGGGNYFDVFDKPSEGCDDANADGFCDAPYVFNAYFDGGQDNLPRTTQNGWGDAPVIISEDYSNVLFLPGIEGSRLYEGVGCDADAAEEKLWEPIGESLWKILRGAGDDKVKNLFLDEYGDSVCGDIYTKEEGGILDSAGGNIYKSFIDEMDGLKADGIINDWKPVAYDWRLSLDDLLNNGVERGGKIFYEEYANTPYIEQTLRSLAASSQTGKVTIVAHSNGGLVAKALLNKLENQLGGSASKLVDKVIMVGAPQSGAPIATGALLYGLDQGISSWGIPILHSDVARGLAENSPMAYHLLPSQNYFDSVASDTSHPVASFAGDAYASEISTYGATINNSSDLDTFILASTTLNSSLVEYANNVHDELDLWTPPAGIEVDQIAGWGADTIAGIDFYTSPAVSVLTAFGPVRSYRPIFTEDGDGTVPVPSALMMTSSTSVKRYWVDLGKINNIPGTPIKYSHKNIFEISYLQDFIKNIIKNSTSTPPTYILTKQPLSTSDKKLTFFLHSPLTLQLTDSSGNTTGLAEDNSITQDIPGSTYGEFGEVKYITVPEGSSYQLTMHGQESGTFSLDMQETTGGIIIASSTIANVPTTENTLASLTISGGLDTASVLTVDENGDGKDVANITPKVGETVLYDPSMIVAPAPQTNSSRSGSRRIPTPVTVPESVATTATTTTLIASSTQATTPVAIAPLPKSSTAVHNVPKRSSSPATVANTMPNFSQTASVYQAVSQQPFFTRWGKSVYDGLYRFWVALKNLF